jgi:probable phosphoglycerate mutase
LIFLIRHGQTEFNVERRLQGRMDSPLTAIGVEQARRMGRVLKSYAAFESKPWMVVSSPLGRTLRTAEIVCETMGLDCPIETDLRLAEIDIGGWECLTREEIHALQPGACDQEDWIFNAPGGETREDMHRRLGAVLADHDETDGRIRLFVSHGLAGGLLRQVYAGAPHEAPFPPQDAVFRLWQGVVGRIDEDEDA